MGQTLMDRVELNKPATPINIPGGTRVEDIRLACLQAAVAGSASGWNDQTVVKRAAAFEAFVLNGTRPATGQTQAWTGDEIQAEALRRAAVALNPSGPAAGDGPASQTEAL
jgi:hypothetical protein